MTNLPKAHQQFSKEFADIAAAYELLATAVHTAGPLDEKSRLLVKLALAIGARHEGAVHAFTRRASASGATAAEIKHVVALAVTTLGMPNTVAAYTWINDILSD